MTWRRTNQLTNFYYGIKDLQSICTEVKGTPTKVYTYSHITLTVHITITVIYSHITYYTYSHITYYTYSHITLTVILHITLTVILHLQSYYILHLHITLTYTVIVHITLTVILQSYYTYSTYWLTVNMYWSKEYTNQENTN